MVTLVLVGALSDGAAADKPSRGCDHDGWQTTSYPQDWDPGEDFDPVGENTLHQATLAGLTEEFGSVDAGIEALGLGDFDGLVAEELAGAAKFDKNLDGRMCWKPFPESGNQPAFVFNVVDNTANH